MRHGAFRARKSTARQHRFLHQCCLRVQNRVMAATACSVTTLDVDEWVHATIWPTLPDNVTGARSTAELLGTYGAVFGVFMAQLLAGKPLTIVGDGTQTRDFTFVTDVARAFKMAGDSDVTGKIMNVGTGRP
ncbi:MAG: NAD-dependent epimerase/dehydratase family protein, partial [Betaproteobacteria bacterium]|nr:NAD-dependent epimerase/dehydratase family protein [Betaproteobacteria bacterium]